MANDREGGADLTPASDIRPPLTGEGTGGSGAESIFRQQRERGATAFRSENGQAFVRMDEFDQTVEHIVIVPPVVGD